TGAHSVAVPEPGVEPPAWTTLGSVVELQAATIRVAPIQSACLTDIRPPGQAAKRRETSCGIRLRVQARDRRPRPSQSSGRWSQSLRMHVLATSAKLRSLAQGLKHRSLWLVGARFRRLRRETRAYRLR